MLLATSMLFVVGCNSSDKSNTEVDDSTSVSDKTETIEVQLDAKQIAKTVLITDTHIDVPYRLNNKYEDVSNATEGGDFDYPRAVSGGLNALFMSIYIPPVLETIGGSKELADKLIDSVEAIVQKSPTKFALAYTTEQMQENFNNGLISMPMGMENGSPIEGSFDNLMHFYDRGIRYITLAHSKANHISDSSYDPERPAKGLTDFGKKLVVEMNKIGIMVDVSHISDDAFYQVMEISKAPVIASHSSARHFTPGWERNMNDKMIKLLAKNDGVIQINFGSSFISQKSQDNYNAFKAAVEKFVGENSVAADSEQVKHFSLKYREQTPMAFASLDDVLDHFDHVKNLVGIDHIGIGSDYDGVGDSLPVGLKDVASYPNLIQGFIDRGYSNEDIEKILSGNLIRVWKKVEEYSEQN